MSTLGLFTYRDAVRHLMDFLGCDPKENVRRDCRSAVLQGLDEFCSAHEWSYYLTLGRIVTVASQTDGTLSYDHTGGSAERLVTLTGATWPSWAALGRLVIDNVAYEIATYESSTTLTLSVNSNPGEDVAAGETYTLYRDTYPMPIDFIAADQLLATGTNNSLPTYVHPRDWLMPQQLQQSPQTPARYTFMSDPNYSGVLACCFNPAPGSVFPFYFIYRRRARLLRQEEYKDGTVSATSGAATVTGSGTTFTSDMVGRVIRLSANATDEPEGLEWRTPYSVERVITAYTSATSITVDTNFESNYSAVKYIISDPIDLERGVMKNAFLRCCEKQVSIARYLDDKRRGMANASYLQALLLAKEGDARSFAERRAGMSNWGARFKDMPTGSDLGT